MASSYRPASSSALPRRSYSDRTRGDPTLRRRGGGQRVPVVTLRLHVGVEAGGRVACPLGVDERLLVVAALAEVMGEERRGVVQVVAARRPDRLGDAAMQLPATLHQQGPVRRLRRQGVPERVLGSGPAGRGPDQVAPHELVEVTLDGLAVDDRTKQPTVERSADDRRRLERPACALRQTIEAGRDEALHAVGDGDLERVSGEPPPALDRLHDTAIDHRPCDLLDEERVALGAGDDPRRDRVGRLPERE